jgi:hypothetical protein
LILALDGVPYRAIRAAREMGAFEGWPEARPMVSTFPSMTNVGFAAILQPFGAQPVPGYEVRLYDPASNKVGGGGVGTLKFSWRKHFHIQIEGFWAKTGLYMSPKSSAMREMEHVEEFVMSSPDDLMLALVSSTDMLTHFHGDKAIVPLIVEFSSRIEELRRRHEELFGRPLRLVMLSDHGNAPRKVHSPGGIKRILREAGLRPAKQLEQPEDVVTVTYGVVGYGVLYLDRQFAERAARAILEHEGVQLAAWMTGDQEMRLVSADGEARINWRNGPPRRYLAYRAERGDPLLLLETQARMAEAGLIDADGYASRDDWFDWSAYGEFPDAPARLVDSLDGTFVSNAATVIFSFEPGYAWGVKPAQVGAWLKAGRLEATHGGLDRESTWGFFLTSDPQVQEGGAVRADRALARWAADAACTTASVIHLGESDGWIHSPRVVDP